MDIDEESPLISKTESKIQPDLDNDEGVKTNLYGIFSDNIIPKTPTSVQHQTATMTPNTPQTPHTSHSRTDITTNLANSSPYDYQNTSITGYQNTSSVSTPSFGMNTSSDSPQTTSNIHQHTPIMNNPHPIIHITANKSSKAQQQAHNRPQMPHPNKLPKPKG